MTNKLRPTLPPLPEKMSGLRVDDRGYPVPFFVAWIDGKPDFRVVDPAAYARCIKDKRCWLCGGPMGRFLAFVIGPMCAINRTTAEPPSHRECAEYAVRACPFLTMPKMRRNEANLPADHKPEIGGMGLKRNPGVALLWITRSFSRWKSPNGPLITIGPPLEVAWFAEGRTATRQEVLDSFDSGCPQLFELAQAEGPDAENAFHMMKREALQLVPQ